MAPDLTYEGSRAERQWLVEFLKSPQTLRPTLILRMPQLNMSDKDAATLADYLALVMQHPAVNPASKDAKEFTPAMATLGKQLYEVKYQCQSCHTIGSSGGYVGPNLSNAGGWLTPAWIEAWLRNPQALIPDSIEPRRNFTDEEIRCAQESSRRRPPSTSEPWLPSRGQGDENPQLGSGCSRCRRSLRCLRLPQARSNCKGRPASRSV